MSVASKSRTPAAAATKKIVAKGTEAARKELPAKEKKPGTRTRGLGVGRRPMSAYEAASKNPNLPRVQDVTPTIAANSQRAMQLMVRHMDKNEAWIHSLVRVMCDIDVGTGPVPISKFLELNELFLASSAFFDSRGIHGWGSWMREDVYRNFVIDGELWVRVRDRVGYPIESELVVPVQFQALPSEYVPHNFTQNALTKDGLRKFQNGVSLTLDRATHYAVYTSHPGEPSNDRKIFTVGVDEMFHVFNPGTGGIRGEVPLASAILRAIKATQLEDSEISRKHAASLITTFIVRDPDAETQGDVLEADEVSAMIDAIYLTPGGLFELPAGYKIETSAPKDEPENFEKSLRWQLLAVCAAAGIPSHYVTQDWNAIPERMVRFVDKGVERRAAIVREMLERQVCNKIWRIFVDYAIATGLWSPPADMKPWELYAVTWKWPRIPNASFTRELAAMLEAEKDGAISMEYIVDEMFERKLEDVQRESARGAARSQALGLKREAEIFDPDATELARRIADAVYLQEVMEQDLLDEAGLDDSIMDDDLI